MGGSLEGMEGNPSLADTVHDSKPGLNKYKESKRTMNCKL